MKRTRRFRLLAAGVAVAVSSGVVVTTTMQPAAAANDYQIIQNNLDDALGELAEQLTVAFNTAVATQSLVEVADDVGFALVRFGQVLVQGTAQFGQMGQGLTLLDGQVQSLLAPYLGALDDPSTAGDVFNPDDISTLLANLGPAIDDALPHILSAIHEGLGGNINEDLFGGFVPGMGTPALLGDTLHAISVGAPFVLANGGALHVLTLGTNYQALAGITRVASLLLGGVLASQINPIEPNLQPTFISLDPILGPVRAVLAGFDAPSVAVLLADGVLGLPGLGL